MNTLRNVLSLLRWLLLGLCLVSINPWRNDAEQAGFVALASGQVSATGSDGVTRLLNDGDPIYAGDVIVTGHDSYTDLDFEDGGQMSLRPLSRVSVDAYHFEPASHNLDQAAADGQAPAFETAVFHLIKGGFRAVSGLIGHISRDDYAVVAPTATIGIRGTEYDLRYCQDDCGDEAENGASPANGLYSDVNLGAIAVSNDAGESQVAAGQAAFASSHQQAAYLLQEPPAALRHMALPPQLAARAALMRQQIQQRRELRMQQLRGGGLAAPFVPRVLSPRAPPVHNEPAPKPEAPHDGGKPPETAGSKDREPAKPEGKSEGKSGDKAEGKSEGKSATHESSRHADAKSRAADRAAGRSAAKGGRAETPAAAARQPATPPAAPQRPTAPPGRPAAGQRPGMPPGMPPGARPGARPNTPGAPPAGRPAPSNSKKPHP